MKRSPEDGGTVTGTPRIPRDEIDVSDVKDIVDINCGTDCCGYYSWNISMPYILEAVPASGYVFKHWELEGSTLTDNPVTIGMGQYNGASILEPGSALPQLRDLDKTVTAVFEEQAANLCCFFDCVIAGPQDTAAGLTSGKQECRIYGSDQCEAEGGWINFEVVIECDDCYSEACYEAYLEYLDKYGY